MIKSIKYAKIATFLTAGLAALIAIVLFLGRSQALFTPKATLYASFSNTSGLVVGSPVRLAGIDIGTVESIRLGEPPEENRVIVVLGIDEGYLARIRVDSVATMQTKGLLGDMFVNITLGSTRAGPLRDGDTIPSREVEGLAQVLTTVEAAIANVKHLTEVLDDRLSTILTEDLAKDVGRILHATAGIVEEIQEGRGLAHELIYDRRIAESARGMLGDAHRAAMRLDRALEKADRALSAIERGDGILHDAIYGPHGKGALRELERASSELTGILGEIRHGRGIAHALIYQDDEANFVENLTEASELIKGVAEDIAEGKGTLGGLLRDPTIYRDLKTMLGKIRRNVLLKALIRMTIKKDNIERPEPTDDFSSAP